MVADLPLRWLSCVLLLLAGCATVAEAPAPSEASEASATPSAKAPSSEGLIHLLEDAEERLPVGFALAVAPHLAPVEHSFSTLGLAFYVPLPPPAERQDTEKPAPPEDLAPLLSDLSGREIPETAQGLLFLHRAAYSRNEDTEWKSLLNLPVDAVEYLFHALLQAHLELQVLPAQGAYAQVIDERSTARMTGVPTEHRRAAYMEAVAGFGAHVLAVANEAERAARRRQARGSDLCAVLDRPGTLFALWPRIFTDGRYTGRYFRRGSEGGAGRWVESNLRLEPEDKTLFLHHILGDWWGEDPGAGLVERYCGNR